MPSQTEGLAVLHSQKTSTSQWSHPSFGFVFPSSQISKYPVSKIPFPQGEVQTEGVGAVVVQVAPGSI